MKENFATAMTALLSHEGGWSNHSADPGGMTNMGVTKTVWEEWVGHPVTEKDMRNLQPMNIHPMYRRKYWDKVSGDLLPAGLDLAVFDFAVNSGPGRAAKMLQKLVGTLPDGFLGPQTLRMLAEKDHKKLIADYNAARLAFLQELPTFTTFGKGWTTRVTAVNNEALAMTA
jgi:lysozyme family protein